MTTIHSNEDISTRTSIITESLTDLLATHVEHYDRFKLALQSLIQAKEAELEAIKKSNPLAQSVLLTQLTTSNIESSIAMLQVQLDSSFSSSVASVKTESGLQGQHPLVLVAGGASAGIFIGCVLVLFLEVFSQAKLRATRIA